MDRRGRLLDWLVLAILVVVWGSAFAVVKYAVGHVDPLWVTTGRLQVAALTLGLVLAATGARTPRLLPRPAAAWLWYVPVGIAGMGLPFLLYAWASTVLPSSVAAICNGATPMFTAAAAHWMVAGERLTARRTLGVAMGFAGLGFLVGPRALEDLAGADTLALLAAVAGAIGYALGNIGIKRAPVVPAQVGAFMFCAAGALVATPFALIAAPIPQEAPAAAIAGVVALGVAPTALASIGYVWLIKRRGPVFPAFATYLAPVWATGMGVLFLGERPGVWAYLALALILAAVGVANLRPKPPAVGGVPID